MRNNKTTFSRILGGLLLAVPAMTLHAEAAVPWAELPSKICGAKTVCPGDREYQVVTKDGRVHKGRGLVLNPFGFATFENGAESFSSKEVAEIRIRHRKPWLDAFLAPAAKAIDKLGGESCEFCISLDEIFGGLFLFAVVDVPASPVSMAVESVRRILPARVIKVAP